MSRAIASARQRRAGISAPDPPAPTPSPQNQSPSQNGLTLPQVINLVDIRLMKLEKFMNDTQNATPAQSNAPSPESNIPSELLEEFESRFELLATEIANMKDIVLKLQSYTMDVNRILLEEKEIINSEDQTQEKSLFTLHNQDSGDEA